MRLSKLVSLIIAIQLLTTSVKAETMLLSVNNSDFQITNVYGDVDLFTIDIEIDLALEPGLYVDPEIINVNYRVFGNLEAGTPSGFPSFDLRRNISGEMFYAQGSSLNFEIAQNADLTNGVQAHELIDNGFILTLNAREIDNGRFHPALFELYVDGSGRIQNSNNVHTLDPLLEVNFGDEYITDLIFEPMITTLITAIEEPDPTSTPPPKNSSGAMSYTIGIILFSLFYLRRRIENKN